MGFGRSKWDASVMMIGRSLSCLSQILETSSYFFFLGYLSMFVLVFINIIVLVYAAWEQNKEMDTSVGLMAICRQFLSVSYELACS